jgi:hypothetical protein
MPITNSADNIKSRYTQGGETERFENRLGWWERDIDTLKKSSDDLLVTIAPKYDRRPDAFAADYFGRTDLEWIVLQFNSIVDINEEFRSGKKIRVPVADRALFDFLNKSTGGVTPSGDIT